MPQQVEVPKECAFCGAPITEETYEEIEDQPACPACKEEWRSEGYG